MASATQFIQLTEAPVPPDFSGEEIPYSSTSSYVVDLQSDPPAIGRSSQGKVWQVSTLVGSLARFLTCAGCGEPLDARAVALGLHHREPQTCGACGQGGGDFYRPGKCPPPTGAGPK